MKNSTISHLAENAIIASKTTLGAVPSFKASIKLGLWNKEWNWSCIRSKYNSTNSLQTSGGTRTCSTSAGNPGDIPGEGTLDPFLWDGALSWPWSSWFSNAFRLHLMPRREQYRHVNEPLSWGAHLRRRDLKGQLSDEYCEMFYSSTCLQASHAT